METPNRGHEAVDQQYRPQPACFVKSTFLRAVLTPLFFGTLGLFCDKPHEADKTLERQGISQSTADLTSFSHPDYGFSITYPREYRLKLDWHRNSRISLSKDSTLILEAFVRRLASYMDLIRDSLRTNTDTLLFFSTEASKQMFYADGPDGSAWPRLDSVRAFVTSRSRRGFVVFLTLIEEYWEDERHEVRREELLPAVYWVDISNETHRALLQVRSANSDPQTPLFERSNLEIIDLVSVP